MNDRLTGEPSELQVGGPVDSTERVYITRAADREFVELLQAGEFVNVVTSRQMGKTSLVYRAMAQLAPQGYRFAYFDLSPLRTEADARVYFRSIVEAIGRELRLDLDLQAFWTQRAGEAASQVFIDFFREVLARTDGPVTVILDEIDATLELEFTDDLFTAIRSIYNTRPRDPSFKRLVFCLVGVATPNELIKTRRTTPYNIGRTIWLNDFDTRHDDLTPLAATLSPDRATAERLLERILYWTGGQPYLTALLCEDLLHQGAQTADAVDAIVDTAFASLDRLHHDAHFEQTLRFISERVADSGAVIDLYERVLGGQREPDQTANPTYAHLKLSGLVKREASGLLVPRNRIYQRLFDHDWISKSRPKQALTRARRVAYAAVATLGLAIVFGGVYYTGTVAPLKQEQQARQQLERMGVTLSTDFRGFTIVGLPAEKSATVLPLAVPQLQDVASGADAVALSLALPADEEIDLAVLAPLTALRRLQISNPKFADLAPIATLTGLQELDIVSTAVSDLAPLAALPQLRELDITATAVGDLTPLTRLSGLRRLSASLTKVRNLAPLAGLETLEVLELSATPVQDLAPLAGLGALRRLDVSNTRVDDLAPLARLGRLEELDVSRTAVSVKGIANANRLPALRHVALDGLEFPLFVQGQHAARAIVLEDPGLAGDAAALQPGQSFRDCSRCPQMVVVPAGSFAMGSPAEQRERDDDEIPQHTVTLRTPFAVAKYEVRFDEWALCVQAARCPALPDWGFGRGAHPVLLVSWDSARVYVDWLSETSGQPYRLLSEAEWEYAARAGTTTARFWGNDPDQACAYANIADAAVSKAEPVYTQNWQFHGCMDGYAYTAPVGSFRPNGFGLHDMIGNVWEWVEDCYQDSYQGAPANGAAWTAGKCTTRVQRGGSWGSDFPHNARSAARGRAGPAIPSYYAGFRVARALP